MDPWIAAIKEVTPIIERLGIATVAAMVAAIIAYKIINMVIRHSWEREKVFDEAVQRFVDVTIEVTKAMQASKDSCDEKNRTIDQAILQNRDEHQEIIERLQRMPLRRV